jgi:hypothetical protein
VSDFCFGLFIFLCVVGLWMLIGHGFWLMTAAFFRAIFGSPTAPRSQEIKDCLRCGRRLRPDSDYCTTCGLDRNGPIAEELADLQATLRQLDRFQNRGDLWATEREHLAELVEARHQRLLGRMPREPEPVVPVVSPAVPVVSPPVLETPVFRTHAVEIQPAEEPARAEVLPSDPPAEIVAAPAVETRPIEADVLDAIPVAASPARSTSEDGSYPSLALRASHEPVALGEHPAESVAPPPVAPEPPPPPRRPRRSIGEVLAAFMEEKNIFWGELIGGLLIVGCSVALVFSLWDQLKEYEYSPFFAFSGVIAALLGGGLYTFHHWKLQSSSRGLLLIATLLVPIDFLVLALLRVGYERHALLDTTVSSLSLALFALLVNSAGRVLVPEQRWLLPLAVLGPSAGQLLVTWFDEQPSFSVFLLLGLVPTACHGLTVAGLLRRDSGETLDAPRAHRLFAFLGIATFALATALGFLVYRNADLNQALPRLAPLVALAGIAPLACGLAVHERLAGNSELAGTRATGTMVALTGILTMLVAVVLAWPVPGTTAVVCALDFGVLTVVAFRHRLPVAHGAALPCLALGYLTAINAIVAPDQEFVGWFLSASGGTWLVLLVLALTTTAEVLVRKERWVDGAYYAAGSGATALASLFLVTRYGGDVPGGVSLIYALYGAGSLVLNRRWRQERVTYVGLGLLIAASLWALFWLAPERRPLWAAVVAAEALLLGVLRARTVEALPSYLGRPLAHIAEWTGLVALFLAIWPGSIAPGTSTWAGEHVVTGACLAALYTLLTVVERRAILAWLSGAMTLATVTAATGWAGTRWAAPYLSSLIGLDLALAGSVLATMAIIAARRAGGVSPQFQDAAPAQGALEPGADAPRSPVLDWLATTWRVTAVAAVGIALMLVVWSPIFPGPGINAATLLAAALTELLLAWAFQAAALTWLASVLLFAGLCHVLTWPTSERSLSRSLLLALLIQATLALLASLLLQARRMRQLVGVVAPWEKIHAVIAEPLRQSALLASVVAVPLVALPPRGEMLPYAGLVAWLAAFWLVVSLLERWPWVFTAFQAALSVAVLYAVTHWLEGHDWVAAEYPEGLLDPYSLQAYGIGLALLGLIWTGLRLSLPATGVLRELLDYHKPALDELILAGLVIAQLAVACWNVLPGVNQELLPAPAVAAMSASAAHAFGGGAWVLLALLTIAVGAALWQREPVWALPGLLLLAVTVPVLCAGPFAEQRATASALRWFLSVTFFGAAIPLWFRCPLSNAVTRLGIQQAPDVRPAATLRTMALFLCVLPVVLLTFYVTAAGFLGRPPAGPLEGSFFASIGSIASNTVPLVAIALTLVGHGLRERSASYVFAAGLLLDVTLMGGYALGVVQSGASLGDPQIVTMLQLGTLAAAVWALLWMFGQRLIPVWREAASLPGHNELITLQICLGVVGNAVLLGGGLAALVLTLPPATSSAPVYPVATPWTVEVGSLLGWAAFVGSVTAVGARRRQQGWPLNSWLLGALGLVVTAFLACNVARWADPEAGYRALMLGWAVYALVCAAIGLGRALRHTRADEQVPPPGEPMTFWVQVAGGLAVALAFKAAFWHNDQAWAAGALGLASVAGAVTAVGRRREGWAFLASLGLDLAAMLIVSDAHRGQSPHGWWIYLIQAGSSAAGLGALLWLAARKQLYGRREMRLSSSPLLALQITLGMLGNLLVLGNAFLLLVFNPANPAAEVEQAGQAGGGVALLLPMAAAFWYAVRASLPRRFFLLASHALLIGVLAACAASPWDTTGDWLSYHILLVSWATAGLLVLALGVVASVFESVALGPDADEPSAFLILCTRFLRNAVPEVQRWADIISFGVVLLSLRSVVDPAGLYWSAGGTLSVSLMSVGMALWSHRPRHVYQSGVLFNLAGCLVWWAHASPTLAGFIAVNVLCLGIGSMFWSVLYLLLAGEHGAGLPFRQVAAVLGLVLMAILVSWCWLGDMAEPPIELAGMLPWVSLTAVAVALTILLWDASALLSDLALYIVGLTAIGLAFGGEYLKPADAGWVTLTLASYVALVSCIDADLRGWPGMFVVLRLPPRPLAATWLPPAQTLVGGVVVGLSVWLALALAEPRSFAGPAAAFVLMPAAVLLARRSTHEWGAFFRHATLLLGVLVASEVGWAALGSDAAALELHRGIVLMAALALMTGVYAVLPRWLPAPWSDSARHLGPVLHVAAVVAVVSIVGLEIVQPELARQLAGWAIAAVALALLWLTAAGLLYAVLPGRDPFHLSERGRTAYVYAGEVLLVLLGIHLRQCLPWLFNGSLKAFYPHIVVGIAFAGAGLAEFFKRRGLRVLAEPLERTGLFLPLFPLLVFWLNVQPFNDRALQGFARYASVWFLTSAFYSSIAMLKRSFRYALIAALAANFGLWSLLFHFGQGFLVHPQLWLIPLAIILLISEHINREQLQPAQRHTLRYIALGMLYISSTADMFITGLGQHWGPPIALMLLAVGGMACGIMLRVQAYLFLGLSFLFLDVCSLVWHAAWDRHNVWVACVFGIALGAGILAVVALFEKRRDDMLRMIEQFKTWE